MLFVIPQAILAQNFNKSRIDSLLLKLEVKDEGMGSITVLEQGQVLYSKGYGYANLAEKRKNNSETVFRIGSISKTFTASLVLFAVEEGKLNLDDRLNEFYPAFENAENITISHLLQHRSGLYNFTNSPDYLNYMSDEIEKQELLTILQKGGSSFEAGIKFEYSNTGYVLLSYILEDLYDKSFEKLLEDKIVKPLGLKQTYFGKEIATAENEALSYYKAAEWIQSPETNLSIPMGAGGISSTPTEIAKFFEALFNGKLVNEDSFEKMTELNESFGMGLFSMPYHDREILGHTGGIDGFQTVTVHFEEEHMTAVIFCNAVSYRRNDILLAVLAAYFDKEFEIPTFEPVLKLSASDMLPFEGIFASSTFPMKITVSIQGEQLMGQATGQSAFPLTPLTENSFEFKAAGVKITFNDGGESMILEQAGMKIPFEKEN